jgi:hypothetical protein
MAIQPVVIIIISIIIIIWIQYPDIKNDKEQPVYKRIFERTKIPIIIICLLLILYLSCDKYSDAATSEINKNIKVFMSIPNF